MVALLAGLKLRLLRNRRTMGLGVTGQVLGLALAVLIGGAIGFGFASLRGSPQTATLVMANVYASLVLAWTIMPLVAFGVDETVDPRRFALLPIRRTELQRGLLAAALIGYLPVANLLALVGMAVGLSRSWSLLPMSLVGAVLVMLMCVIFSRALAATMSGLLGSRRGRDLGMVVSFGLFALYYVASTMLGVERADSFASSTAGAAGEVLSYSPPGALALLPSDLADGQWGRAALRLAIVAVAFVLGWRWWGWALDRSLTTVGSQTENSAGARGLLGSQDTATSLTGTARLVMGRDLTMMWRDPMRRMPILMAVLVAIGWPFVVVQNGLAGYAVLLGTVLAGTLVGSTYAVEGSGLWLHAVAFGDRMRARGELWGHAGAAALVGIGLIVAGVAVQTVVRNGWEHLPGVIGVCVGGLLGSIAVALACAAYLPYAVPQSRTSMFASRVPGQGGRAAVSTLAVLIGGLVAVLPAGVLAVLGESMDRRFLWAALIAGPVLGMVLLWLVIRFAADHYLARTPEILQLVSAGDRV